MGLLQELLAVTASHAQLHLEALEQRAELVQGGEEATALLHEHHEERQETERGEEQEVPSSGVLTRARLWATLAYTCSVGWHLLAMLLFMTYNTPICLALLTGIAVGHYGRLARYRGQARGGGGGCHSSIQSASSNTNQSSHLRGQRGPAVAPAAAGGEGGSYTTPRAEGERAYNGKTKARLPTTPSTDDLFRFM